MDWICIGLSVFWTVCIVWLLIAALRAPELPWHD